MEHEHLAVDTQLELVEEPDAPAVAAMEDGRVAIDALREVRVRLVEEARIRLSSYPELLRHRPQYAVLLEPYERIADDWLAELAWLAGCLLGEEVMASTKREG